MEVMVPDFDFNSTRSSPHVSLPSTPKCSGELYYFSAPTSPTHLSLFYRDFDQCCTETRGGGGGARIPFEWEEKPGTPKSPAKNTTDNFDFAFDVNDDWEKASASLSAAELFDGGMIKPLKPPPRLQLPAVARISEKKPSPRWKKPAFEKPKTETDPFAIAARNAMKAVPPPERGREKVVNLINSSSRRTSRSLSPLRDTQSPANGQKKWRIKDFFLFRSASEGHANQKDPLKKNTAGFRHSSFRATDSPSSGSGSRRRGPVSAHEAHYMVNRAVSEDLKKKTFLPYKQGILGRLAFNPAVHALANGFGFSRR